MAAALIADRLCSRPRLGAPSPAGLNDSMGTSGRESTGTLEIALDMMSSADAPFDIAVRVSSAKPRLAGIRPAGEKGKEDDHARRERGAGGWGSLGITAESVSDRWPGDSVVPAKTAPPRGVFIAGRKRFSGHPIFVLDHKLYSPDTPPTLTGRR